MHTKLILTVALLSSWSIVACGRNEIMSGISDSSQTCVMALPLSATQPTTLAFNYDDSTSCNYFAATVSGPMSVLLGTALPTGATLTVNVGSLVYTASQAQSLQAPAQVIITAPLFPLPDATGGASLSYPTESMITSTTQPPAQITITLSVGQ